MDLIHKFERIKEWYDRYDQAVREREGRSYFRTSHGLWGASGLLDVFELFTKQDVTRKRFADYGSGDGRIVLVASLFTRAVGIEADETLTTTALKARDELKQEIPELERAAFKTGDYYEEVHDEYDIIFFYPDHPFPERFQEELKESFTGSLLVYNQIHLPRRLRKGRTYWAQQVPIISYPINTEQTF